MPEVTDPELLRALNGSGGPVYGAPPKSEKPNPGTGYTLNPDGSASYIPGGSADPNRPDKPKDPSPGFRWGPDGKTQEIIPGGPADPKVKAAGEKPTEAEQKVGTLLTRIVGGMSDIQGVVKTDPDAQRPGFIENARGGLTPGGWMGAPARAIAGEDRRTVHDAQRDMLDALLTLGTGAAYNPEQLSANMTAYFPQYGDSDKEAGVKNQRLRRLIESAKVAAGPRWAQIEQSISPYMSTLSSEALGNEQDQDKDGLSYANPGMGGAGTVTDEGAPPGGESGPPEGRDPSGLGGLAALAKQGVTLGLSDEASGIGGYLSGFLTGEDPTKAYGRERDTERKFLERARKEWGLAGTGAEFLGGGGAARVAAAPASLSGIVRQGAGIGAVGGFGYGEGDGSVPGALTGAVLGGGLGYGLGRVGQTLANRATAKTPDMTVVEAGQRQGIPIRQPDALERLRGKYAATESTEHGGPLIRSARAADLDALEQRVLGVGGAGANNDHYALGNKVQSAGHRYISQTRQQAGRLYDKARELAGDQAVQPTEAVAAIERNIAELQAAGSNSNSGQIAYLEGLREDLSKPLSIEAVQNLRTNMRGQIGERGLTGTDAERRVGQVIDAANIDLARELPQEASNALRAADDFYRQRQEFINGTLKAFMGDRGNPLPAETAAKRLVSMAQGKGNYDRFAGMWRELEPSEQADVSATIAGSLGRLPNGDFSAAAFIKALDPRNGINPRTARLIFGDDGASALADLRVIADAKKSAMDRLSPSGQAISKQAGGLKTLLMGALGFGAGGPGGAAAGAVAQRLFTEWGEQRAARMLLNPDFTKWLRNAPNTTNPRMIDRYFSRLAGMGSVAANDNQAFTNALMGALKRSPASGVAAKGDEDEDIRREPPR